MKLVVLLATYNSEDFLKEQIDSILNQTFSSFDLYIRDDGSSDQTMLIVKDYLNRFSNIFLVDDKIKHRKAMRSFMWMLENIEADYYMFCDHDDYWMPNKIELTMQKMLEAEVKHSMRPIVIHTDLKVVDSNLKAVAPSFWKYSNINPSLLCNFNYLAVYNAITGCTMLLNNEAKKVSFPLSNFAIMHDSWIALNVVATGGLTVYISSPTILYRQHSKNVVGAKKANSLYYVINKFFVLREVIKQNRARLKMIREIQDFSVLKYIYYKLLYNIKK